MNKIYKGVVLLESEEQFETLVDTGEVTLSSGEVVHYSPTDTTYLTPGTGEVIDVGSNQFIYKDTVLPAIKVEKCREIYTKHKAGAMIVIKWTILGTESYLSVVSADTISGTYSMDVLVHNKYHCAYSWTDDTADNTTINPEVGGNTQKYMHIIYVNGASFNRTATLKLVTNDNTPLTTYNVIISAVMNNYQVADLLDCVSYEWKNAGKVLEISEQVRVRQDGQSVIVNTESVIKIDLTNSSISRYTYMTNTVLSSSYTYYDTVIPL